MPIWRPIPLPMINSDTLYLSDLDGTLLTPEVTLSPRSIRLLGEFIRRGGKFSVATARTPASIFHILSDLPLQYPISMMNGVLLYDPAAARYVRQEWICAETAGRVLSLLEQAGISSVVFFLAEDTFLPLYRTMSPMLREYAREREIKYAKRFYQTDSLALEIDRHHGALYFCAREKEATFAPLLPKLSALPGIRVECYRDVYTPGAFYLEIFSEKASKENATRTLRALTGVKKIVSFGDNLNDLPMFRASDACYAVENAVAEVKAAATATIGANTADGVAEFLSQIE